VFACLLVVAACSSDGDDSSAETTTTPGDDTALPAEIQEIMDQPRYEDATWSLLVTDVESGETFYSQNPDEMSLTGSTRKLFSVGMALDTLGADHREDTPVYRLGDVGDDGVLDGDLALVGAGDLTFGGRRLDADTVEVTDFDHNDANGLGTAQLTPQDPLYALDDLARQVSESGITSVSGDVVVDDRLFVPYRVPNGNLLITPVLLNENMVDTTVTPTETDTAAALEYRPETEAFAVDNAVETTAEGSESTLELSDDGRIECIGTPDCSATVSGDIAVDYAAPFTEEGAFVGTFRVEEPNAFMRTAFIEALARNGVTVTAPAVAENPADLLTDDGYEADTLVASYESAPYDQFATLVLKVSLNLGANLSLSLFGVDEGADTIDTALAAERAKLIDEFGIDGDQFDFPTNGSGTPDSQAAPRAIVDLLIGMHGTDVADVYLHALPIMGVDGSLATVGRDLSGKGHIFAKTGTTISPDEDDDDTLLLKAQNLAGYIETKSGRLVAYALMVNNAGPVVDIEADVSGVITDEAEISNLIYENL
jgi:D-alanyl-D-alanine carboxypeptidase/D-alanyl-D-alanine-endopeptidase (penicillin-binding protein 4)